MLPAAAAAAAGPPARLPPHSPLAGSDLDLLAAALQSISLFDSPGTTACWLPQPPTTAMDAAAAPRGLPQLPADLLGRIAQQLPLHDR